ncbi:MAG: hypothetical protein R2747_15210 [Pyrinomonadaceae bacterium]
MKQMILISILFLCFSLPAFSQTCPEIKVHGPDGLTHFGDVITLTAVIDGQNENFEYDWTVSAGKIISGQNTSTIQVLTEESEFERNNLSEFITATLKVKGLPKNCNNEASETVVISPICILPMKADEYGKASIFEEYAHFQNLFETYLQRSAGSKAYVRFEIAKDEKISDVKKRLTKIFKFLDKEKFDRNLMIFDICRSEERRTVFQVIPDGAEMLDFLDCDKIQIDFSER